MFRSIVLSMGLCLATITATPVVASSVLQFTFDELNDHADLIIEGRVVAVQSRMEDPGGQIATYVRIAVLERLKGPDVGSEIELRFVGGTVEGLSLEITDMRLPAVDEVGIYFVESLRERQVHPLVGWSQGHFIEQNDDETGQTGVFTAAGEAVTGIRSDVTVVQRRQVLPGTGTALAVLTRQASSASQPAMKAAEFKNTIRRAVAGLVTSQEARP
jgi:hypothetical protein